MLLLTSRGDEVHPPLTHLLAELDRGRLAAELRLAPLTFDDVDAMIRAIFALHRPVPAEFLTLIYSLTEGYPFFIEETLGSLVASGDIYSVAGLWSRKPIGDPRTLARSLNRMGNGFVNVGKAADGLHAHEEALNVFQTQDDTPGMAETLDLLGMANGIYGYIPNAMKQCDRAVEILRALGDNRGMASSLASRAVNASPALVGSAVSALGTPESYERDTAEALRLARRIGSFAGQTSQHVAATMGGKRGQFAGRLACYGIYVRSQTSGFTRRSKSL